MPGTKFLKIDRMRITLNSGYMIYHDLSEQ